MSTGRFIPDVPPPSGGWAPLVTLKTWASVAGAMVLAFTLCSISWGFGVYAGQSTCTNPAPVQQAPAKPLKKMT